MKLNYKKAIILTILSTMSMGVVCLSISDGNPVVKDRSEFNTNIYEENSSSDAVEDNSSNVVVEENSLSNVVEKESHNTNKTIEKVASENILYQSIENFINQNALITPNFMTYAVQKASYYTPQLPVYLLEEDGYPEIDNLMKLYYNAKICCDMDTLKSISTNPSAVISKEDLLILTERIDNYHNIKCYTKKAFTEGTYIVYVYHEIDFIGLETFAPGLSKFYVVKDLEGDFKIYDGEMNTELKAYFDARNKDSDVISLMEEIETMSEQAKEKDKELKSFWAMLDH